MLVIEMAKIEINRRLYWLYANCRDGQNRINWRLYWIYANCTFVETAKIESTGGHIGFIELI